MTLADGITGPDILGLVGSVMIAGAYLAVTQGWLAPERPGYNGLNLAGALLLLWSLWHRPNAGAILIEVVWVGIALLALWRHARRGQA